VIGTAASTVAQKIVLAAGAILLLNAIFLIFTSNLNMGQILLGFVSVVTILYAVFWDKMSKKMHVAAGVCCAGIFAFVSFLAVYGNLDNATYDEDAVIVLGAGIRGEEVGALLASRLDTAIDYHHKNPRAVIVVSGGQGPQEDISEALAMERYLTARGVPQEMIIKEERSTSTHENFIFSAEILRDRFPDGFSCVLITNDFHVYRATRLAQSAGIETNHIGTPTRWYTLTASYLREMPAVAKTWAVDRT
jgi:uncharacterized SAM-binding protein YcdF (DUF218 family)